MAMYNPPVLLGTAIKFNSPVGTDTMMKGGVSTSISTRFQCINAMKEYEHKSMEELRLEDYRLKLKANASVISSADITLSKGGFQTVRKAWKRVHVVTKPFGQLESNANALQERAPSTQTKEEPSVKKLLQGLKEILLNRKYSDFVLHVKGIEFRVHKIILAAQSPVFAAMLEHDTKEKADGIANIHDCEPLTMEIFLVFLYTGRVENLNSDNVLDLYVLADKYQVAELSNLCIKYMKNNISIANFCDILNLSLTYNVRELTEVATQFFLQNSTEIAVTAKWQTFLDQNPVAGNELFLKALNLRKE